MFDKSKLAPTTLTPSTMRRILPRPRILLRPTRIFLRAARTVYLASPISLPPDPVPYPFVKTVPDDDSKSELCPDDEDTMEMFPEQHLLASVQIDTNSYPIASKMVEAEHDHICKECSCCPVSSNSTSSCSTPNPLEVRAHLDNGAQATTTDQLELLHACSRYDPKKRHNVVLRTADGHVHRSIGYGYLQILTNSHGGHKHVFSYHPPRLHRHSNVSLSHSTSTD